MSKTRVGFIGAGGIAQRHVGVLDQFADVDLVAFTDLDFARAVTAASRFGARAYDNYADMLEDGTLDAVFICIPPFAHGAVERAVMARGLPFFVEKPLSLDIDVAESLALEISAARLLTAVGYHWRYLDIVEEARRLLTERPARLLSGYWLDQTPPPQWWWHQDQSGGQMVEQTTHIIDLARYLAGDVEQVFGLASHTARCDFPGLDIFTVSTASLKFASGAVGNIASTCLLNWGHRVGLHVFAEGLALELSDHDLMVDVGAGRPVQHVQVDPVWREDRDFIDAVRGDVSRIRCSYGEALKTHRIAMAINQSAQTGQAVLITPPESAA
jgi:predicted dehydrogenase